GAVTAAVENAVGYIDRADRGTLVLDEVLQLTPQAQVKLLSVLESNEVERLGDCQKRHVHLRVVAAAQDDTLGRLEHGPFRRDLFQRLAGIVINLPTLLERREDLRELATHFASRRGQMLEPSS